MVNFLANFLKVICNRVIKYELKHFFLNLEDWKFWHNNNCFWNSNYHFSIDILLIMFKTANVKKLHESHVSSRSCRHCDGVM